MRVQFKRFLLLPPDHITDLYSYSYLTVLNTGHLYKLLLWNWFVTSTKSTISQTFTSFRQFILSVSKCYYSLGIFVFCMFFHNKQY